jgi:hypothetical protein
MPMPRNNPVYNVIDTVTVVKGTHTFTLGGTFRRTTMWETTGGVAAAGPTFNLGVVGGDPASAIFNPTSIPGVRTTDLANALALYALLTQAPGINSFSPNTGRPGLAPLPIFAAAFGARGSQPALPDASRYANGTLHHEPAAGRGWRARERACRSERQQLVSVPTGRQRVRSVRRARLQLARSISK